MKKLRLFLTLLFLAVGVGMSWAQLPENGKVYFIRFVSNQDPQKNIYVYLNDANALALNELDDAKKPTATDLQYLWYIEKTGTNTYYVRNVSNPTYFIQPAGGSNQMRAGITAMNVTIKVAEWGSGTWNNSSSASDKKDMLANSLYFGRTDNSGTAVAYRDATTSFEQQSTWSFNKMSDGGYDAVFSSHLLTSQVFMDEVSLNYYSVTYKDEYSNTIEGAQAIVSAGVSDFTNTGANRIAVGSTITSFVGKDYLVRNFVSATINGGTTYYDVTELLNNVHEYDGVEITLADDPLNIKTGKYYTIKNSVTNRYAFDSSTSDANNLSAGLLTDGVELKHIFQFETVSEGKFYIKNINTNRYVKRPNAVDTNTALYTGLTPDTDFENWVTNYIVPNRPDLYAIGDPTVQTSPITAFSDLSYWHNHSGGNSSIQPIVIRWSTTNEAGNPSQWYITEVPVITLNFVNSEGNEIANPGVYTVANSFNNLLTNNQVLACFKGVYFDDYLVVKYELNGTTYTNRTLFFDACHNLTEDATATIVLRQKVTGEVDITLDIYNEKGKYYDNIACSGDPGTATQTDYMAWRYTNGGSETDINGKEVPSDLVFTVFADTDTEGSKVGNKIYNHSDAQYRYKKVSGGNNCLTFQSKPLGDGNDTNIPPYKYKMSVSSTDSETYYILQYELGVIPNSADFPQLFENEGGSSVLTGDPAHDAKTYTITDTPAKNETWFTTRVKAYTKSNPTAQQLAAAPTSQQPSAANFFQVRIVNETYLRNSMDRGYAICTDALYKSGNQVGYPTKETYAYKKLDAAIGTYEGSETEDAQLENYIDMLQAYSKYISCDTLNMPEDCHVYTISFIKADGTRMLLNKSAEDGIETVAYTNENLAKTSARWISHCNDAGNLVLVNKDGGKYLTANESGLSLSETYDADNNSFASGALTQDLTDYMASATDEKLLGAIYLKNVGETNLLTMQNSNDAPVVMTDARYEAANTSALLMEFVESPDTYNSIKYNAVGEKYYATYYGFYPVAKPENVKMYYVTETQKRDGEYYLQLNEVTTDVIKPYFAVILIAATDKFVPKGDGNDHLHIGEYTSEVQTAFGEMLDGETNLLKGNLDPDAERNERIIYGLSSYEGKVGFYKYTGQKLPVRKAFFELVDDDAAAGTGIRGFQFDFNGVATTIELTDANTDSATSKDAVIYDLSGRRVKSAANGLFIINGKKVVK